MAVVCSQCGHLNEIGKFCVKCGAKLQASGAEEQAATVHINDSAAVKTNEHVEKAKVMSKMYINYFIQGMKNPTTAAQSVNSEQFINGLITMIIYAISIPLMFYFSVPYADSFTEVVLKPSFYYLLFIGFVALVTFAVVKLGRVPAVIQDVFARFGTFLIVPTAFFIGAFILSLIKVHDFASILLLFGFLGLFIAVPFTIFSFKKDIKVGLDAVYGTFLTYLAIIILILTIARIIIDQILYNIGSMFSSPF
ncbi:hypothetical protein [Metabacillus fastidiosus]|uniref:hypothetical protein n=1 Tax=Metabacillus fastidiosus TaxID=1458 RepID=UPI003D2C3527